MKFIIFALLANLCVAQDLPKETGSFYTYPYRPAFASIVPQETGENYYLTYSSFFAQTVPDSIVFSKPSGESNSLTTGNSPFSVTTNITNWPNEVDIVPADIFGGLYAWSIAAGFFLGKSQYGGLYVQDMSNVDDPPAPVLITALGETELWYYHRVIWMDMDNDGVRDALTARARGAGLRAELIWFKNPNLPYITPNWEGHVLADNVDISFCVAELPNIDGSITTAIIGAGFWGMELTVTWSSTNDWTDTSSINQITIDNVGYFFDVEFNDINNDGRSDLLVTTWSQPGDYPGLLLVYEVPENWQEAGAWLGLRHILSSDFKSYEEEGKGAPGAAKSFHPRVSDLDKKRYIAVSGDDEGTAYLMIPNSQDVNDWTYTQELIFAPANESTVGAIDVADSNEDGFAELFIPSFERSYVVVMSFDENN